MMVRQGNVWVKRTYTKGNPDEFLGEISLSGFLAVTGAVGFFGWASYETLMLSLLVGNALVFISLWAKRRQRLAHYNDERLPTQHERNAP